MITFRQRLADAGIRRPPWLTLTVFLLTAVPSCVQVAVPAVLRHLERTPAGLTGQWWRSVTSLAVQDGGVLGTLSNLAFLLVIGSIAEQVLTRPRWLALYLVPGLAGEFAAYRWQPTGAGNSVAVCGLSGALAVLMLRDRQCAPAAAPYAQLLWAGALAGTVSAIAAGLIFVAAVPLLRLAAARRVPAAAVAGAAVLACGVALVADQNIHGAALLAGALLGLAVAPPGKVRSADVALS
jgi:membrane associated rhomboid family serine protease